MRIPFSVPVMVALCASFAVPRAAGQDPKPRSGLLFFASYPQRNNTAACANPYLAGALLTLYWSEIEPREGQRDWSEIDRRIKPWVDAGRKAALRVMWSSSGNWPDPAAKNPTPRWVLAKGAKTAFAALSRTEVPLIWDPVYRRYQQQFLAALARKFDGDPNVLFIDATPGAETNPYRFRRINVQEPEFKQRFLETAASDGRRYSHELWLEAVKQGVDDAKAAFKKTPLLVTLNVGSLDGPEQFQAIGAHCVERGCHVGQNGLNGQSYQEDSARKRAFLDWGASAKLYFETVDASGGGTGTLMDVMKAAERIGCDYLGVYAVDVLKGTRGQPSYDSEYEKALEYGSRVVLAGAPSAAAEPLSGFRLEGERWTYTDASGTLDGVLVKPEGDGPFPAILVSHGLGGSAQAFGLSKARELVKMGFVCIAPNYTHARRAAPGQAQPPVVDRSQVGASAENLRRGSVCLDILESLPYVDRTRLAAYGHSMGAFATVGLAAKEPKRIRAAAITAGGVAPRAGFPAPSEDVAAGVRAPLIIFHGDTDRTVRPEQSARLKEILDRNGVPSERHLFPGIGHPVDREKAAEVFDLMGKWFERHGVLAPGE